MLSTNIESRQEKINVPPPSLLLLPVTVTQQMNKIILIYMVHLKHPFRNNTNKLFSLKLYHICFLILLSLPPNRDLPWLHALHKQLNTTRLRRLSQLCPCSCLLAVYSCLHVSSTSLSLPV